MTAAVPRVAVIGGGLAGLAAAAGLAGSTCRVELFEARGYLGGRAASFVDPASGEAIDHCQHVALGCCTNFVDLCRRVEIDHLFARDEALCFVGPNGRESWLHANRFLPPPLHLAHSLWRLKFLSLSERLSVARALLRLARMHLAGDDGPTAAEWLLQQGQSQRTIDRFWSTVITSALGETLDRVSLRAARKVFVDAFMVSPRGHDLIRPRVTLDKIYAAIETWLSRHGAAAHVSTPVRGLTCADGRVTALLLADGQQRPFDSVVLAVPWRQAAALLEASPCGRPAGLADFTLLEPSPITSVHLWFDRAITPLAHVAIVGRLSQWLFSRATATESRASDSPERFYYQVVISASRELAGRNRDEIAAAVQADLVEVLPVAARAKLLAARVVTQHEAVFSPRPGVDRLRPPQRTSVPGLYLAGDWTATGWPATMESAVRSGYQAAEAILASIGSPRRLIVPDLPRGRLARWLCGPA